MWQAYPFLNSSNTQRKPLVGISACLCGDKVRYDGLSKGQPGLISALTPYLELHKICPEVAIGMGTPRAPIRLCKNTGSVQAVGAKNPEHNVTQPLKDYAKELISSTPLCGYIFKSRSPSCGIGSTPIHKNDIAVGFGDGIFAHQIQQLKPWLPVAEEESLIEVHQQQHFVLLAQLVDLFFKNPGSAELTVSHAAVKKLRALLPLAVQKQLLELTRTTAANNPEHYLILLIKGLQRLPYQLIKPAL